MEVKPRYKQTKVGLIPVDWEAKPVGDVGDVATGNTPPTRDVSNYGDEFLFVSPSDMGFTKYIRRTEKMLSKKGFSISRHVPTGSILFVCIGSTIGKCGIAAKELTSNQQINAIISRSGFSAEYIYYALSAAAPAIKNQAGEQAVPIVNKTQFSETILPLPPTKAEQEAIAEALSDADALIESLEHLIVKKHQIKQGAMRELLTGKKRLRGFSGEWEVQPIGSFSGFVTKGATPTTYGFNWEADGVLFLRSECVSDDGLDLTQSMFISEAAHAALIRGEVRSGDILITITGNVGRVVRLEPDFGIANINQHIARIRVKDQTLSDFVFFWLSQPKVRAYYASITTGQAYPQISLKQVRETGVPLPSLSEQTAIAAILSDMDAEIEVLEEKLAISRHRSEPRLRGQD